MRTQAKKKTKRLQHGKTCRATEVLVSHLIGRDNGASFQNQSQSEVKQNPNNLGLLSTLNMMIENCSNAMKMVNEMSPNTKKII